MDGAAIYSTYLQGIEQEDMVTWDRVPFLVLSFLQVHAKVHRVEESGLLVFMDSRFLVVLSKCFF